MPLIKRGRTPLLEVWSKEELLNGYTARCLRRAEPSQLDLFPAELHYAIRAELAQLVWWEPDALASSDRRARDDIRVLDRTFPGNWDKR